jgi:hypothetical protein
MKQEAHTFTCEWFTTRSLLLISGLEPRALLLFVDAGCTDKAIIRLEGVAVFERVGSLHRAPL